MSETTTAAFDAGTREPTLREKLSSAMALIGYVQKDSRNRHGGYNYLSEKAVKMKVQDALGAYQLVPEPTFKILSAREVPDSKGVKRQLYDVECTITIRDSQAPDDDAVVVQGLGSGIDHADKGLMKAQTASIREAWKNLFCIPSGDDPEATEESPAEPGRSSTGQVPTGNEGQPNQEKAPAGEVSLTGLSEQRKRLELTQPQVLAVIKHAFGKRLGDLSQQDINQLVGMFGRMAPETVEQVKAGDLKSIPTFEGGSNG